LAGFQVATNGRFWVATEENVPTGSSAAMLLVLEEEEGLNPRDGNRKHAAHVAPDSRNVERVQCAHRARAALVRQHRQNNP
jgi:hypothetical protein